MKFVLDASVALSWLLEDAGAGQVYADAVFGSLARPSVQAEVPVTWSLEVANVIAKCELRGILQEARTLAFLSAVSAAPITCDPKTNEAALSETLQLSRRYRLSSYDASYLELALRSGVPLATLDEDLRRPATKAGVKVFKPP